MLASWSACVVLLLGLLSIFYAASGDDPGYAPFLAMAGFLASVLLIRAGKSEWARKLVLSVIPAVYLLAVLTGPGRSAGVQMYFLPALILTIALFSGRSGGMFTTLFGMAAFAAWYVYIPDHALPTSAVLDLAAGSFLFGAMVVLFILDFDRDLLAKEVLIRELRYRLGENLGLLDRLLAKTAPDGENGCGPTRWERFHECVLDMADANRVVTSMPDAAAIDMGIALQETLSRVFAPGGPAKKKLVVKSVGTLPADKAISVLLLSMELSRSVVDTADAGDTFHVSFRRFFDHAELGVELRDASGILRQAPLTESAYARMIGGQIPAEVRRMESGQYHVRFRV